MDIDKAIVYDTETYPNFFSLAACSLERDDDLFTFEISPWQDDRSLLLEWLWWASRNQIPFIGFNNLEFDYPIIHRIMQNPDECTPELIAAHANEIISGQSGPNRFAHMIWENDRLIPQIDLLKINHFDNSAKRTSLKALQFAMRSESIEDLPVAPGTYIDAEQRLALKGYGEHDATQTKKFARICRKFIDFRVSMKDKLHGDVLNFNDTKIGEQILIQRLGDKVCFDRSSGRKRPRQTIRTRIPLSEVIFPYVRFEEPEFKRVHQWLFNQVLEEKEFGGGVSTKGVFTGLKAHVGGIDFCFGLGGIHGSVERKIFHTDDEYIIIDADVASQYPSVAIVNKLYPEHIGQMFVDEYAALKQERFNYPKGTSENGALKLGLNGAYGKSNDKFSCLLDPKFTMQITVNGQLMVSMLGEWLIRRVPGLQIIQVNTDGITVRIPRTSRTAYDRTCRQWQDFTCLDLEFATYKSMWIRDVNSYIALDEKGKIKQKGAYWYPVNFPDDITNSSPPAWHKDHSSHIVPMAACYALVHGVPVEATIRTCFDPYMFAIRGKATRGTKIYIGDIQQQQRIIRYFVSNTGSEIYKLSPPVENARFGAFKKKNGIDWFEYHKHPDDVWNPDVHTKNQSRYEQRKISLREGWLVTECNDINRFDWSNLNYDYYITEAKKLLI